MAINFNANPYWDDFDASKNYKRILAVPDRVEQAREFTQIQSQVQHQITQLGDSIYKNGQIVSGSLVSINADKTVATISSGKVYAEGDIITFESATDVTILGVGTEVIGLVKTEAIITELEDPTLRDPAQGYDNFHEPGAHRLRVTWEWDLLSDEGYGIYILDDGVVRTSPVPTTVTESVLDIIARRNFEQFGNFTLSGLEVSLVTHPDEPFDKKQLVVNAGEARILGYDTTLLATDFSDFELARETDTTSLEAHSYQTYDALHDIKGAVTLGYRPVAYVDQVIATELTVDGTSTGGVTRATITRGSTPGGSDLLSRTSVVAIAGVNQGGTWDPATEAFVGGTTFASGTYALDGNRISWSPSGAEPTGGSSYSVAYTYRKVLVKQQMAKTLVTDEAVVHGDATDLLAHDYVCETNDLTQLVMYVNDDADEVPLSKYVRDTDFSVTYDGLIDWYDHEVQVLEITKGASNTADVLAGFTSSYTMGTILAVAYYTNPSDMEWDDYTQTFIDPTTSYDITTDYLYTPYTASIAWSPGGAEPTQSNHYFVAILARKYKTSNHPTSSESYYVTYNYWNVVVPGDYLARDSFYSTWVSSGSTSNVRQHYGLDLEDKVNFWRAYACQTYTYNSDKPYPDSLMEITYRYYLPRYAAIYLGSTEGVIVDYGASSDRPGLPITTGNNRRVLLALTYCPADSLEIETKKSGVKTYKVADLHGMNDRVVKTEYNLASTLLDLDAKSIPITGKVGVMTTSFTNHDRLDVGWVGSAYTIDPNWEELAMPHTDSLYTPTIDLDNTTAQVYASICSIVPSGTSSIEQTDYSGDESIAPYALAAQTDIENAPSAYMSIFPTGDTLVIPRTQTYESRTDAEAWSESDVFKLTNPTQWFSNGWTGGTERHYMAGCGHAGWYIESEAADQTQTFTSTYIRDIQGNCRQIEVTWDIPGGLIPTAEAELDYFIYFGGVQVTPSLTNSTPPGSVSGSFRPRSATQGASGTFTIPPNIPEGRIEVKVMSTPMVIIDENLNTTEWRHRIITVFDAAVVEQLTLSATECRCNCYCNCFCNCWDCRGRCGTGPLAQTLEPNGQMRVLKELVIDFSMVHPTLGTYACMVKTDNGQPTSNTVSTGMVARKLLTASQLAGAGMKTFTFDDPLFMNDDTYAIVVTGEDKFNLFSIAEVAAGRDIRCKVAKLGDISTLTGKVIGSQPFKAGMLWRSLTGVTWEQDQKTDLKFKATFNTYPTNQVFYVYMNTVTVVDATAFLCTWDSTMPDGTSIVFEYRTPTGKWTEFQPYSLTYLSEVSDTLDFRAKLSTTVSTISPFCTKFAGLYVQSQDTTLLAATRNFETVEADTCDIFLDTHLPSGCTQDIKLTFDNGETFTDLANNSNGGVTGNLTEYYAVDLNATNVKYRHHWKVSLGSPSVYTNARIQIGCESTGGEAKLLDPRFSKLMVIASNS